MLGIFKVLGIKYQILATNLMKKGPCGGGTGESAINNLCK